MTTSIHNTFSHVAPEPNSRIKRSQAQKKALVEDFNTSGLTKTAFCKHLGIAISCLSRWQKTLTTEASAEDFI
ncbi:hypothetical protein CWI75_18015 [Kineobactrum sediminis]|uniref:Transposase n=1 Tax=Kineobactrum sediminis TaxID=1905677 RepID=A0A2N5XY06_9GAMM|nr:hypothetical protein [Kineobactrum sediminis]PLW80989.1 hypothetical protein CWI75_18015 [Kineobactrum sediminis]